MEGPLVEECGLGFVSDQRRVRFSAGLSPKINIRKHLLCFLSCACKITLKGEKFFCSLTNSPKS